jgi:hypothetical protein
MTAGVYQGDEMGCSGVALSLWSAETPRFNLPEMRVKLEWEPEGAAYRLSFLSGAQVSGARLRGRGREEVIARFRRVGG